MLAYWSVQFSCTKCMKCITVAQDVRLCNRLLVLARSSLWQNKEDHVSVDCMAEKHLVQTGVNSQVSSVFDHGQSMGDALSNDCFLCGALRTVFQHSLCAYFSKTNDCE